LRFFLPQRADAALMMVKFGVDGRLHHCRGRHGAWPKKLFFKLLKNFFYKLSEYLYKRFQLAYPLRDFCKNFRDCGELHGVSHVKIGEIRLRGSTAMVFKFEGVQLTQIFIIP